MVSATIVRYLPWVLGAVVAGWQVWIGRQVSSADATAHLDMARGLWERGEVTALLNGTWSPLYPVIVGGWLALLKPDVSWTYPAVVALNLPLVVLTWMAGAWLMRAVLRRARHTKNPLIPHGIVAAPTLFEVVGPLLIIGAVLGLADAGRTGPDLLVAAVTFAVLALLVDLQRAPADLGLAVKLGLVLSAAALVTSVWFPLGLVAIGCVAVLTWRHGHRWAVTLVIWILLTGPYVLALSAHLGRPTFGEAGRLNLAWSMQGVAPRHWQGGPPAAGTPLHSTRQVWARPDVFLFHEPFPNVTHGSGYDPSYFYAGVQIKPTPGQFLRHLDDSTRRAFQNVGLATFVVAGLFLCWAIALGAPHETLRTLVLDSWPVWAVIAAAVAGYTLTRPEARYLGPFLGAGALVFWGMVRVHLGLPRRLLAATTATWLVFFGLSAAFSWNLARDHAASLAGVPNDTDVPARIAESMIRSGLKPGDRIASTTSMSHVPIWSYLARVRIVGEVDHSLQTPQHDFWAAAPDAQRAILDRFREAGAVAVVSEHTPSGPMADLWRTVEGTRYSVYWLSEAVTRN